ncbi:uncharacterized protein PG998_011563 [Apiospora kogelbergensis]|uniref:uncharacterized protein n=1 Tax=Apiospora kogelbergensis TaxID=1337665 RepID=UPI003131FEB7
MKVNFALLLVASGYVAGHAGMQYPQDPVGHEWRRTSSDSRSPCPGLNILANHGYLPRDGRNINKTILSQAATEAYGFPPHFNDGVVDGILKAHLQTTGTNDTFHLGDLSLPASHNVCDHFDIGVWYRTGSRLGLYDLNYDHKHVFHSGGGNGTAGNDSTANPGPTAYVSVETAALAQAARYREAMAANKDFTVGVVNGSIGTSAFYLYTMWDDAVQAAPKSWVRSFFEEERIPYKYGFPSPGAPKRGDHMRELSQQIYDITMGV